MNKPRLIWVYLQKNKNHNGLHGLTCKQTNLWRFYFFWLANKYDFYLKKKKCKDSKYMLITTYCHWYSNKTTDCRIVTYPCQWYSHITSDYRMIASCPYIWYRHITKQYRTIYGMRGEERKGEGGSCPYKFSIFNRPGVAGAVLQSPPSFIHSLSNSVSHTLVKISSKHSQSQTRRAS